MLKFVIIESVRHELIVEKSRFIAYLAPINSEGDFANFLQKVKKEASGARHYPYAYTLENTNKASDDGEPSGTAGRPLLDLLLNHKLSNSAVIVVRYFGGIKLGAGRLLRTYVETANQAISQTDKYIRIPSYKYEATIKSSSLQHIEYLFLKANINISDRQYYGEEVKIQFEAEQLVDISSIFNVEAKVLDTSYIFRKEE